MKNNTILIVLLFLFSITTSAQFTDDMEYPNGPPYGDWWVPAPIIGGGVGLIPGDGTTDAVLDLGNQIFGEWCISFWMFVPSGKEAYWNLQGEVPIGAGEWIVGNVFFNQDLANPGVGLIDDAVGAPINFTFPHDQWFRVIMDFDITNGISLATWEMNVDGNEVISHGTAFTNSTGTAPTSLGGINFFSISADNELYVDDFEFHPMFCFFEVGFDDFSKKEFTLFPNPTNSVLNIEAQEPIERIRIYNLLGSLLKEVSVTSSIDVSHLKAGLYLIEVSTASGKSIQKFIKE